MILSCQSRHIFGLGLGLGDFSRFVNLMQLSALSVVFSIVMCWSEA
jgi:hypothetical protein